MAELQLSKILVSDCRTQRTGSKTSGFIEEIAAASMEQRNGANQVNNAIQQLNVATR